MKCGGREKVEGNRIKKNRRDFMKKGKQKVKEGRMRKKMKERTEGWGKGGCGVREKKNT